MASIWKQNRDVTNDVKRNNFDLSFSNHSTFKFGYLYPVFCKRVYPTDSFRIDSAFDLKMMPLVFPVQSRIRANLHFFYVRNKNLWKNWEDWISGLKDNTSHPHPYITPNDSDVVNGSIYDFLNTPTTVVTSHPVSVPIRPRNVDVNGVVRPIYYENTANQVITLFDNDDPDNLRRQAVVLDFKKELKYGELNMPTSEPFLTYLNRLRGMVSAPYNVYVASYSANNPNVLTYRRTVSIRQLPVGKFVIPNDLVDAINECLVSYTNVCLVLATAPAGTTVFNSYTPSDINTAFFPWQFIPTTGVVNYSDLGLNYYKNIQPLNALAYRAYQSIYYGYYANDVLQPLMINGEKEFNKFIENDGDGLDTTNYHLYKRNYELDFLTSALPSPQAGPAPLVGVSALGGVTITDANGVSTGQAVLDSDGNITKIVATSPIASVDHARTMMNIAALGFNINDLRSANALQRLAEQTLRSGYRYINWVKGQYGRSPKYDVLDMAEFIGGYSRDVTITSIISQADTLGAGDGGMALGDYGANGRIIGGSNHSITHYCDDYGWIIGVMSVTPTPAYSQLLPKQMIAPDSPLDYANPFMNQIGMQPITYREVCPIQAYIDSLVDSDKSVDDVFGYQRPNYDEVGSVDEVHGEFRGTMKDFLINRQFDGRPELGKDFIEINPSEINDIFANQNPDDDVFIGHLGFKVTPKRPFPRVHVPGLGR